MHPPALHGPCGHPPNGRHLPGESAGFTLIEITFAIVVLAGSLMVLLGLQSAATRATFYAGKKQEAMLAARALMSAIELGETELEPQDTKAPLHNLLEEYIPSEGGIFPAGGGHPPKLFDDLTGGLRGENLQLPGLEADVVPRGELEGSGSPPPTDALKIV